MRLCYGLFLGFLAACGSGTSSYNSSPPPPPGVPPPPPAPGAVAVSVADFSFAPDSILVSAGTPVQWTNAGTYAHTVTSDNNAFASPDLAGTGTDSYGNPTAGGNYMRTFSSAGTFPYHCGHHPTMRGKVVVNP